MDSDEDSDAYIKPAKKTKPTATAQPSMTDFEKKSAGSKAAAKPASSTTARKPSGITKPPPKKAAQGSDDEISMDELQLELAAPVAPRATAPRRAAAATKPAYIELSDSDHDD